MPWPFGRKRTLKEKENIAESKKKYIFTDDHRIAISDAQRGKKRGPYRKKPKPDSDSDS